VAKFTVHIDGETTEIDDLLDHRRVWSKDFLGGHDDAEMENILDKQIGPLQ